MDRTGYSGVKKTNNCTGYMKIEDSKKINHRVAMLSTVVRLLMEGLTLLGKSYPYSFESLIGESFG